MCRECSRHHPLNERGTRRTGLARAFLACLTLSLVVTGGWTREWNGTSPDALSCLPQRQPGKQSDLDHQPNPPSTPAMISSSADSTGGQFNVVDANAMGLNHYETLVLASIQGVSNKEHPSLFVIDSNVSRTWLEYINGSTPYRGNMLNVTSIWELVSLYRENFTGIILFDGDDPDETNLASGLAGVFRALLVPSQVAPSLPGSWTVKVNVTADLEGLGTRREKYLYAIDHYFPLCNQTAFAFWDGSNPKFMRDYIVSENLFTFWKVLYVHTDVPLAWGGEPLDPDPPGDLEVFEDFIESTPPGMAVIGFMWPDGANEGEVIARLSAANKYLIATDFFENLAFMSRMVLPAGYTFQQTGRGERGESQRLENKVYVTGIWSDGDNVQYVYNYMRPILWDGDGTTEGSHGAVPTGWTVNPSLYSMAPYVLKYYYETATENDTFVGALSGKGYCKPDYFTDLDSLASFIKDSNRLQQLVDIKVGRIWTTRRTGDLVTRETTLQGIYDGYGGKPRLVDPRVINGVPIIESIGVGNDTTIPRNFIKELVGLGKARPVFVFLHLHAWTCTTRLWTTLAKQLDAMDGVSVVDPETFMALAMLHVMGLPSIQATLATNAGFIACLVVASILARRHRRPWKRVPSG